MSQSFKVIVSEDDIVNKTEFLWLETGIAFHVFQMEL